MFLTLDDLDTQRPRAADLVVVGSGPAGIALTSEFLDSGVSVLLVESGYRHRPTASSLNEVDSVALPHSGGTLGRARTFGGTGQRWSGQCLPLDEHDFAVRDWVSHSGWPLTLGELQPVYRRAERLLAVEGVTYDGSVLGRRGLRSPLDPAVLVPMNTVYSPKHRLGTQFRRRFRRSRNVRVLLGATVTRVCLDASRSRVEGVELSAPRRSPTRLPASAVVLCCGAIENPRLLLASGVEHDLLGACFQDHPYCFPAEITDGSDLLAELYQSVFADGLRHRPKSALSASLQQRRSVLNAVVDLEFEYPDASGLGAAKRLYNAVTERQRPLNARRELRRIVRDPFSLGQLVRQRLGGTRPPPPPGSRLLVRVQTEQAPSIDSRVDLSPRQDVLGARLPRLHWQVGELEWRTTRAVVEEVAAEFARCGLGTVHPFPWLEDFAAWRAHQADYFHHAGTTRMSADASAGVVDEHCRIHGIDGLHVGGASVFPTSGFANPTLTIVALALRLADRLR